MRVTTDLSVWNKRQKSHSLSQNVFLPSIIYLSEEKKIQWNKQHFGKRLKTSHVLPIDPRFTLSQFFTWNSHEENWYLGFLLLAMNIPAVYQGQKQ